MRLKLPVAYSSIEEQPGAWKISGAVPDYAAKRNMFNYVKSNCK